MKRHVVSLKEAASFEPSQVVACESSCGFKKQLLLRVNMLTRHLIFEVSGTGVETTAFERLSDAVDRYNEIQ